MKTRFVGAALAAVTLSGCGGMALSPSPTSNEPFKASHPLWWAE
jgi:hypothetical protein